MINDELLLIDKNLRSLLLNKVHYFGKVYKND